MAMIIWVCACANCPRDMAAREVAGLVRQHADELVRRLRLHDRAVIDENPAAIGDEGVERAVVDDDHLDVLLLESCDAQDRAGIFAKQLFGLGVAQDRRPLVLLGAHRRNRRQNLHDGKRSRDRDGGQVGRSLARCVLVRCVLARRLLVKRLLKRHLAKRSLVEREMERHGDLFWAIFCDWRRAEHRVCPNNPWNAASLGHPGLIWRLVSEACIGGLAI
jgi:hypothetical protein